ncbi:MCFD2-like protein [Mya arenaria]|uniref:MCFD2-like protein n=1 Tax=Mya arenaria TaxID=6604 RepID=A0ABY7FBR2_MYAAR|nr:multiple coagulation factor deficiency protein 2 homolog [Mya arenaria]WAR19052.1 MCFD2-like protein [Mya arenaria]
MHVTRLLSSLLLLCSSAVMVARGDAGHNHDHAQIPPDQRPTNFNDPKFTQDQAHLKEHMKDEINMKERLSPEEMEFHYFRLHDTNNDTHLDGIEIMQAMAHMLPVPDLTLQEKLGKSKEQIDAIMLERQEGMMKYYEDIIDRVLRDDDVDKDGYLTYSEFARARRREEYHNARMHEEQMHKQQMQFEQFQQYQAMQAQNQQGNKGAVNNNVQNPPNPNMQNMQQQQQFQQFQQFQQQQQNQQQGQAHGQGKGQGQGQQQQQQQQQQYKQ